MPTTCTKVKLREGGLPQTQEWAAELTRRAQEVLATLKAEGVLLEAAFLDSTPDGDYLIYIMHGDDLEKAVTVAKSSPAPIDAYHQAYKKSCWEGRTKLPALIDFTTR